jgi:hypothetical protein
LRGFRDAISFSVDEYLQRVGREILKNVAQLDLKRVIVKISFGQLRASVLLPRNVER